MPEQMSPILVVLQWIQLIISIFYPVALVAILFFAWRDFRRFVNHKISGSEVDEADDALAREVKEFSE